MYQREPSPRRPCGTSRGRGRSCACGRRAAARARAAAASGCRRCGSCRARCRTAGSRARARPRRSAARPLTTSLTVPSPPSAHDQLAAVGGGRARQLDGVPRRLGEDGARARGRARGRARRGRGQRRPAAPFCAAGLTITYARAVSAWPSRAPRGWPARSCASTAALSSASRDADELALDDDVGDRQQAGGLDAAQRGDREEDRPPPSRRPARRGRTSAARGPVSGS